MGCGCLAVPWSGFVGVLVGLCVLGFVLTASGSGSVRCGVRPAAFASASLAFFASRFFLFFNAAFDNSRLPLLLLELAVGRGGPGGDVHSLSTGICLLGFAETI